MIALDFETFSGVNLKDVSYNQYFNDPQYHPQKCGFFGTFPPDVEDLSQADRRAAHDTLLPYQMPNGYLAGQLDFLQHPEHARAVVEAIHVLDRHIVLHNRSFDTKAISALVSKSITSQVSYIDTAMLSRRLGGSSNLDSAVRQWMHNIVKMSEGRRLLKKFSLCDTPPTAEAVKHDPDWAMYGEYAYQDARLAFKLAQFFIGIFGLATILQMAQEQGITDAMNDIGWPVDLAAVDAMLARQKHNTQQSIEFSHVMHGVPENFNYGSFQQKKEFCLARGVNAKSFDEASVAELLDKCEDRAVTHRSARLEQVISMLETLQEIGGSSLKKLPVIKKMTDSDGRLRDQYLHCGAVQSLRTTGVGVQMQNLPRLSRTTVDFDKLEDPNHNAPNTVLAGNLRRLFKASQPGGQLIVGDFSSIESRGLAALAGARWKLSEYKAGRDMYKVLAAKQFNIDYLDVTPEQRTFGKVGELACGYGAGPESVRGFAKGMGVKLDPAEAANLVRGWRDTNPEVVELWKLLDDTFHLSVATKQPQVLTLGNFSFDFLPIDTPTSITNMHPGAKSFSVRVNTPDGSWFTRYFHGVYERGSQLVYHKPSSRVTGDPWTDSFTDPKTKQRKHFTIYGGKLTGILTQSLCRELFFKKLKQVTTDFQFVKNVNVIGQFHDEIILEWIPEAAFPSSVRRDWGPFDQLISQASAVDSFKKTMNSSLSWLPISASIGMNERYIK